MLLYDNSIEIDIPKKYQDISGMLQARDYQYIFFDPTSSGDNVLIIDLMEPEKDVSLHIEEIIHINDITAPQVIAASTTTQEDFSKIKAVSGKYMGPDPNLVDVADACTSRWAWVYLKGMVPNRARDRDKTLYVFVGINRHPLSDIVLSIFREQPITDEDVSAYARMLSDINLKNPELIIN